MQSSEKNAVALGEVFRIIVACGQVEQHPAGLWCTEKELLEAPGRGDENPNSNNQRFNQWVYHTHMPHAYDGIVEKENLQ